MTGLDCTTVREALAGPGLLDAGQEQHVADCEACRALSEALAEVDVSLRALPPVEPPPPLVVRTLAVLEEAAVAPDPEKLPATQDGDAALAPVRLGVGALALASLAGVVRGLATLVGLLLRGAGLLLGRRTWRAAGRALAGVPRVVAGVPGALAWPFRAMRRRPVALLSFVGAMAGLLALTSVAVLTRGSPEASLDLGTVEQRDRLVEVMVDGAGDPEPPTDSRANAPAQDQPEWLEENGSAAMARQASREQAGSAGILGLLRGGGDTWRSAEPLDDSTIGSAYGPQHAYGWAPDQGDMGTIGLGNLGTIGHGGGPGGRYGIQGPPASGEDVDNLFSDSDGERHRDRGEHVAHETTRRPAATPAEAPPPVEDEESEQTGDAVTLVPGYRPAERGITLETTPEEANVEIPQGAFQLRLRNAQADRQGDDDGRDSAGLRAAARFLAARERVQGLSFQEPRGYWANTYVPGDASLRQLHRSLFASRDTNLGTGLTGLALAELASPGRQPFDAPTQSALAVYLNGDRAGVEGPSRMVLQVGLKATARHSGQRGPMSVAVVLDLRQPLDHDGQAAVSALLSSLSRAHDSGDRFSLLVAGPHGGQIIAPGAFRYGEVTVASRRIFGDEPDSSLGALGLPEALRTAAESVGGDDASTPLGSGLVLLVSRDPGGDPELVRLAHVSALAGVTTSVVGLGAAPPASLEALALAGQGRRRELASASDADRIVRDEIEAVSRIVARAVRLRIRLAPGVKLVNVLGSYRLDAQQTERVREAEHAADQEMARRLGIQADRGEDEDGIQIVIPAFYADDAHVILLDVVVPGPGPVADVRARYKDLVHLRNGTTGGTLQLARGLREAGPLERNVLANLLGYELSQSMSRASAYMEDGDPERARAELGRFRTLLSGIMAQRPELARDLESDTQLTSRYLAAIAQGAGTEAQRSVLVDSLAYASWRRVLNPALDTTTP